MSSPLTSKSLAASIISKPLFIIDAESIVIFAPILQLGWLSACSTVTSFNSSYVLPKNGPPEAVKISFLSALLSGAPCRHWKIAECSLSTGKSFTPLRLTASVTKSPPATSVSLLARAMSFFASIAAMVGFKPTMPTTELSTSEALGITAASIKPSIPPSTLVPVSLTLSLSSAALSSLKSTASSGLYFLI